MSTIRNFILIIITYFTLPSCNHKNNATTEIDKNDSLMLKVFFHPSFHENSEVLLLKSDSINIIQLLIKNNFRVDKQEDTFWFKKIYLTTQQYLKLDSTLIKICKQKQEIKNNTALDGMRISSLLTYKRDTNIISFLALSKKEDSIHYNFTKSLFEILKNTFQDSLITDYFNDIEEYIDESKFRRADPKKKIDQLRMKKYHWTIRSSN